LAHPFLLFPCLPSPGGGSVATLRGGELARVSLPASRPRGEGA